jgi:hypothetical protein
MMNNSQDKPSHDEKASTVDSLNSVLIEVEGGGDTTIRPLRPSLARLFGPKVKQPPQANPPPDEKK